MVSLESSHWRIISFVLAFIVLAQFIQSNGGTNTRIKVSSLGLEKAEELVTCNPSAAPSFWALGLTFGTDKVPLPFSTWGYQAHTYNFPYEHYLRPIRCKNMSMMEIGLGCGMPYKNGGTAEGRSIMFWLVFLPHTFINSFEYAVDCATNWYANDPQKIGRDVLDTRVKIWTGDQANEATLLNTMAKMGLQDIIIDDGGHSMMQQQTSLHTLLPFVKPGGYYVVEDLQTSFVPEIWHDKPNGLSMVDYLAHLAAGLHSPQYAASLDISVYPKIVEILPLIKSIDCFREACVISRWPEGEPGLDKIPEPAPQVFDQVTGKY